MKNVFYLLALLLSSAPAFADNATDLLAAQSAYQHALKTMSNSSGEIITLQNRLSIAEQRAAGAQAEAADLRNHLTRVTQENSTYQSNLSAAGQRLDAAWAASRNTTQP